MLVRIQKIGAWLAGRARTRNVQVLAGLVLLGFVLRMIGLDFGLPNDSRPDEIPLTQVLLGMTSNLMAGDFSLNPHWLNYPSLYLYLLQPLFLLYYQFGAFTDWNSFLVAYEADHTALHLILRWFSVVCGTAVVWGMARLAGAWLRDDKAGWVAALLAATNYLMVRNSHFGSVDMLLTLGVVLSLWGILVYRRDRTPSSLNRACLFIGLAIGAKYPAILLLIPLWVTLIEPHVNAERIDWAGFFHAMWKPTGLALLVFSATTPWMLLDFPRFIQDVQYESVHFFTFRLPDLESGWLFYPAFALWYGVGGLVLLFALIGIVSRCRKAENRWEEAIFLSFLAAYFMLLGFNDRLMTRYALPLVPVLLLYATAGILRVAEALGWLFLGRKHFKEFTTSPKGYWIRGAVLAVALVQPVLLSVGFDWLMTQPDSRTLARNWIIQNVPGKQPVATGPRLGMVYLPGEYGQLVVESGPQALMPPEKVQAMDISPRTRLINTYADVAILRQMGVRYVITYGGMPVFGNRDWELAALEKEAGRVYFVDPLKRGMQGKDVGRFDPLDAFFLPFDDFHAFERPGPIIQIFDLNLSPSEPRVMESFPLRK